MDLGLFRSELARITQEIEPARATPMHDETWLRACAESINPDDDYELVVAEDEAKPIALAPFRSKRFFLTKRLFLLGAEDLWLHSDVLYKNEDAARDLAKAVVKQRVPARFGHFPRESFFTDALIEASRGNGFLVAHGLEGSPYIRLDESWREPEKKLRSKRRHDLKRRRKKAMDAHGDVSVQIITPSPEEVEALYDESLAIEARGWKGRAQSAMVFDQYKSAFFRRYLRLASEKGIARICFLTIGGKKVAFQIGVVSRAGFWGFRTGYDEEYRDFAPGILLFLEVVRYAANAGLSTHEFLGRPEPWTKEWTTDERPLVRLRFYPYTFGGMMAVVSDGVLAAARKLGKRVRSQSKLRA